MEGLLGTKVGLASPVEGASVLRDDLYTDGRQIVVVDAGDGRVRLGENLLVIKEVKHKFDRVLRFTMQQGRRPTFCASVIIKTKYMPGSSVVVLCGADITLRRKVLQINESGHTNLEFHWQPSQSQSGQTHFEDTICIVPAQTLEIDEPLSILCQFVF